MIRAASVARWFVILLALAVATACGAPTPSITPTADVSGTVTAQVQATIQALGGTRNNSPATPASVVPVNLPIVLDERFAAVPNGWPNDPTGVAWHDGLYHLAPRRAGQFVAVGIPLIGALGDAVVSATFRKIGGPSGGGYGLIVRDQNMDSRNGTVQGGRFIVAELGDAGTIGIWRREDDHWVDLLPWTPSAAVHSGRVANELTVQTIGDDITLLANGTRVAQASMGLPKGGVGVFVGGDGNQVVLERFTVRSGSAQVQQRPTPVPSTAAALPPVPTSTPAPAADGNRGIAFGKPTLLSNTVLNTVAVSVSNTTDQVKSFTVKATFKIGDTIAATASGAVNDILPGQKRIASLVSQVKIPSNYDSVRVDVDTMVREARNTTGGDAANKITFGKPSIKGAPLPSMDVEVTNADVSPHSFTMQAGFYKGDDVIGLATGAVNDLAPGQTKTASLLVQGTTSGADSTHIAIDTVVK